MAQVDTVACVSLSVQHIAGLFTVYIHNYSQRPYGSNGYNPQHNEREAFAKSQRTSRTHEKPACQGIERNADSNQHCHRQTANQPNEGGIMPEGVDKASVVHRDITEAHQGCHRYIDGKCHSHYGSDKQQTAGHEQASLKQSHQGCEQSPHAAACFLWNTTLAHIVGGTVGTVHDFLIDGRSIHRPTAHLQTLFSRACLRHKSPQNEVSDGRCAETENAEQHEADAPRQRVGATKVMTKTGNNSAHQCVLRIPIELATRKPSTCSTIVGLGGLFLVGEVGRALIHFLRIAYAAYYFFYMFHTHCLHTSRFQFRQQFGHAVLDVVGNLLATFATGEVRTHVLFITFQKLVCIFIDGIKLPEQVDCDILFHVLMFLVLIWLPTQPF